MPHSSTNVNPYLAALQWLVDVGADEALQDTPNDRTAAALKILKPSADEDGANPGIAAESVQNSAAALKPVVVNADLPGTAQARAEAARIAASCNSLEELRDAIAVFEGLSIRRTAKNMVFADGNPAAHVMVIGEAPGADEDRDGRPFMGASGALFDKIFKSIGLARHEDDPAKSIYVTNFLNWRPPGGRSPTQSEIDISMPFIERHIALAAPRLIVILGGTAGKTLLGRSEPIGKLRGQFHEYVALTEGVSLNAHAIQTVVTYHPDLLLNTPIRKKDVWADMLNLRAYLDKSA